MQLSQAGRAFIEANEARKYTSYQDEAGVWTNGIGHTGPDVFPNQTVDDAQIERWFTADVAPDVAIINAKVRVALSQEEFDALVDFVFNVGTGAFANSTLLRVLNEGHYELVRDQLVQWNKYKAPDGTMQVSGGLATRRRKEADMFDHGMIAVDIATLPVSNVVPEKPAEQRPTLSSSRTLWAQGAAFFSVIGSFITTSATDIAGALHDTAADLAGLIQYSDKIKYVFLALSGIAVVLTFAERVRKLRIGK